MPLSHLIALISNAHPVLAGLARPEEGDAIGPPTLGLDDHCSERPEFIRINPSWRRG